MVGRLPNRWATGSPLFSGQMSSDCLLNSFNELIDPRGLRHQMFSARPTPDLYNERPDAYVREIENEDGVAYILRCLNLQTFNTRH